MWHLAEVRDMGATRRQPLEHRAPEAAVKRLGGAIGNRRLGRILTRQAAGAATAQSDPSLTAKRVTDDECLVWKDGIRYRVTRRRAARGPQPAKPRRGLVFPDPRLEPPASNPRYGEDAKRRYAELGLRLGGSQVTVRGGSFKEFESASAATGSEPLVPAGTTNLRPIIEALQKDTPLLHHTPDFSPPVPPDPIRAQSLDQDMAAYLKSKGQLGGPRMTRNLNLPVPDVFAPIESWREPFVDVATEYGRLRFSAFASATVNDGRVSSAIGKASVGTGRVGVGAEVGKSSDGVHRALGYLTLNLGSRGEGPASAATDGAGEWTYEVEVERLVQRPGPVALAFNSPRSGTVLEDATQKIYLYFAGEGSKIDPTRSKRELEQLEEAVERGFRVTRVEAFTSPEGSLDRSARFQGNRALAQQRARAAADYVRGRWPHAIPAAGDRTVFSRSVEGKELYGALSPDGPELAGSELLAHVVEHFGKEPAEERHRTDELLEKVKRVRDPGRRAALIYPLLRRAEITLTGTVSRFRPFMPGGAELVSLPGPWESEWAPAQWLPPDVLEKAGKLFLFVDSIKRMTGR
jgi:hypothetical protein